MSNEEITKRVNEKFTLLYVLIVIMFILLIYAMGLDLNWWTMK